MTKLKHKKIHVGSKSGSNTYPASVSQFNWWSKSNDWSRSGHFRSHSGSAGRLWTIK